MVYTEVYAVHKDGTVKLFDEVETPWGMVPVVWRELEERYLSPFRPEFIPSHVKDEQIETVLGRKPIRVTRKELKEIGKLSNTNRLSKVEQWVLCSTFNHVIVMREGFDELIHAYRTFRDDNNVILNSLADVYLEMKDNEDIIGIAWSISTIESPWVLIEMVDESHPKFHKWDANDKGLCPIEHPYNIFTSEKPKHWILNERMKGYTQEVST